MAAAHGAVKVLSGDTYSTRMVAKQSVKSVHSGVLAAEGGRPRCWFVAGMAEQPQAFGQSQTCGDVKVGRVLAAGWPVKLQHRRFRSRTFGFGRCGPWKEHFAHFDGYEHYPVAAVKCFVGTADTNMATLLFRGGVGAFGW